METPCILSERPARNDGYVGVLVRANKQEKYVHKYAHRLAYEAVHGPIPEGMTIDHLCFVRNCINVEHLRMVTKSENSSRQRRKLANPCEHVNVRRTQWGQCIDCKNERNRQYRLRLKEKAL